MITENDIIFDNLAEEVFPYLDDFLEAGDINIHNYSNYIMEDYQTDVNTAEKLFKAWIQTKNDIKDTYSPNLIEKRVDRENYLHGWKDKLVKG